MISILNEPVSARGPLFFFFFNSFEGVFLPVLIYEGDVLFDCRAGLWESFLLGEEIGV